jgi:hypothetical protein
MTQHSHFSAVAQSVKLLPTAGLAEFNSRQEHKFPFHRLTRNCIASGPVTITGTKLASALICRG